MDYPCRNLPKARWCDRDGLGGFMGHTCLVKPEGVLEELRQERIRQNEKWGYPQPPMADLAHAMTILGEEYGEACKAVVEFLSYPPSKKAERLEWFIEIRKELIQTAAVAVSIIEHMDGASQ